jgi:D-amino-acid dehydrogenase
MSKRVVIVGGGVIGLSVAHYAARKGFSVTVLERESADHAGCSHENAGLIVPSHVVPLAAPGMIALGLKWMWNPESPFYIKPRFDIELMSWCWKYFRACNTRHVERSAPVLRDWLLAGRECFEELPNEFGFEKKGLLMLCKTAHALEEEAAFAEKARQLGLPAEVLDARQVAALEPGIRMNVAGGVLSPQDCHLVPRRLMETLQRLTKDFRASTEVTGWRRDGGRIVAAITNDGEVEGDEFVVAGGSWSPRLVRLPMQAGKGYSVTLAKPRQHATRGMILTEARVAVTPLADGGLRFGGTMELSGLNEEINPVRVNGIIQSALKYYPDFEPSDFAGAPTWCGLRPCSPDGLPYIGRVAGNLSVATGHAMMGTSLGLITGKAISNILSGEKPPLDISLFHPNRYA